MRDTRLASYRLLLLATVATAAMCGSAGAANYTNTTPASGSGASYTLHSGDTLSNSSSVTSTGTGQPAVQAGSGVSSITNSGVIQGSGASGLGIQVVSGGSVGSITNSGTVQATNGGNAIVVGDTVGPGATVGTLTNSGLIQTQGTQAAIEINAGSTINSIVNSAGATIQTNYGNGIDVQGSVGTIANAGTIDSTWGDPINVAGTVGTISNSGTLETTFGNAINVAGTVGTINNSGLIRTGTGTDATAIAVSGTLGNLTNSGLIEDETGSPGTALGVSGTIGSVTNSGTITSNFFDAITVSGTIGTLTNSGSITGALTGTSAAIAVAGSIGSIVNSGDILGFQGEAISLAGTIGSIANSGSIGSFQGDAINVTGSNAAASLGTITNSGVIQTFDGNAISVTGSGAAASLGTIANSGVIQSFDTGAAITLSGSASIGAILNSASGLIEANSSVAAIGIGVTGGPAIVGTISNSGTILAQAAGEAAIGVGPSGSLAALDNNAGGLIRGAGTNGVAVSLAGAIGSILNSGAIGAPSGTAISIASTGTVVQGITNTASGLIQGGPSNGSGIAIDDSAGTNRLTVTTAGTIIGAVKLGTAGDTVNVTGGRITGAIIGLGTTDTVNFALGNTGSFATGGSISGVGTIGVASGVVNFQTSVASAMAFTIGSGATGVLNPNASIGAASFSNAGAVSVGTGTAAITGNYTQTSTGALKVTVTNATTGRLNVSGSAGILGPANAVWAHVPLTVTINSLIGQTETVLSAGTLSVSNTVLLTADSDSVGLAFNLTSTSTSLLLTGKLPSFSQALAAATAEIDAAFAPANAALPPTANDLAAQTFLSNVLAGLGATGNGQLTQTLLSVVTALTPTQLVQLEKQIVPSQITSSDLNNLTTSGLFSTGVGNIFTRLSSLRPQDTGLAAGDEVGRGIEGWVQPFGSFLNQDAKQGFDGYSLSNYGVTLGGDTLVRPDLRVGAALTLANSNISYSGFTSGSTASTFSAQLALYGVYYIQHFFIDGLLSGGYNHYNSHTPFGSGIAGPRDANYGGSQFGAKAGAGYDFKLSGGAVVTPYASVQQLHVNYGGYTTTGGYPFNLSVAGQSADITETSLGARLAYPIKISIGTLTPEIHANWLHDFGSNQLTTTYAASDLAGGGAYTMVGPTGDRDTYNIGISATLLQRGPWSFQGGYDFDGRSSSTQNLFFLQAKYRF